MAKQSAKSPIPKLQINTLTSNTLKSTIWTINALKEIGRRKRMKK